MHGRSSSEFDPVLPVSHIVTCFNREMPSVPMYKYSRCCFVLSIIIFTLSITSLVLGCAANKVQYAIIANLVPVLVPAMIYFGITKKTWGKEALRVQCIGASCYLVCIIIVNSVILSSLATVHRYCYGDLASHCIPSEDGDYDLECESSETSQSTENTQVSCPGEATLLLYLTSIVSNMALAVLMVPYLVLCQTLKGMLFRIFIQEHISPFDQSSFFPVNDDQPIPFTTLVVKSGTLPLEQTKVVPDSALADGVLVPPTPDLPR